MLQHISEDGIASWHCDGCLQALSAHISHSDVQWHEGGLVALPRCECGTQMFVRATFSDKELQLPSVEMDAQGTILSVTIPPGLPPNFVVLDVDESHPGEPRIRGVMQHPAIARHTMLATHLRNAGKHPLEEAVIV